MTVINNNYDVQHALDIIANDYGYEVSVNAKLKDLLKYGINENVGTSPATIATMPTGETEETFVYRNLITHFSSTSASDTGLITIEGHTVGSDLSVSSITQTGGTATLTTATDHRCLEGDWIYIEGAGEAGYNGIVQVATVETPRVLTYEVDSGTASPATGTITATNQAKTSVSQTVQLDGQTKTALTTPLARCNRVFVPNQNRAANLVGQIYVYEDDTVTAGENDTAAKTHMITRGGKNNSEKSQTTLSDSEFWLVTDYEGQVLEKGSSVFADVRLESRQLGGVFGESGGRLAISSGRTDRYPFKPMAIFPPNADMRLQAEASTANTKVGGSIQGMLAKRLMDPATETFIEASGATDTRTIDALMRYIRAQGLSSGSVLYPMRSTHGATSSIVYPCGDLTANTMTLVASPTVDAEGIALNGTSQYGFITDFLNTNTLTVFMSFRQASATPTASEIFFSKYESSGLQQSVMLYQQGSVTNDPYGLLRSSDGGAVNREIYIDDGADSNTEKKIITGQWVDGGGRFLYVDGVLKSLTLSSGTAQTEMFDSTAKVVFGANNIDSTPANFAAITCSAMLIVQNNSITSTQREQIEKYMMSI